LSEAKFEEVLTRAAQLSVPVLFRNFATRFGPMGRGTKTSDINSYLKHQESRARPPPTCQIQGETIDAKHLDYRSLLAYFAMDPSLRGEAINMLDNPVEGDLLLVADFNSPEFIMKRDVIDFCIPRSSAHKLRDGVKFPFIQLWMLVSASGCVSGFHRDMLGLWTGVEVQRGLKFWFWVQQNEENIEHRAKHGKYECVSKFSKVFGIPLSHGNLFIMSPGVIDVVITKGDSFANGIYFLLTEALKRSTSLAKANTADDSFTNDKRDSQKFYYELLMVLDLFRMY